MNNFLGQGPSTNQGIGQGIGEGIGSKVTAGLNSITSSVSESTSGFDSFYIIVVAIAVIVLILVLAFLGWTMSKQKATDTFPKLQTPCPDFWGIESEGGKTYCKQPASNQVNYGNDKASSDAKGFTDGKFDFTNAGWSAGGNAVCAKKKWANSHGINWDTVTNANYC